MSSSDPSTKRSALRPRRLPGWLRPFFWEYDGDALSWEGDRALIVERLLSRGTWATWRWVRQRLGDEGLRAFLVQTRGRALTPRQIHFWKIILDIPDELVEAWIDDKRSSIWFGRTAHEDSPRDPRTSATQGACGDRAGGGRGGLLPRGRHRAGAPARS